MITIKQFIDAVAKVAQMAKQGHWKYGDSHALPPCSDKIISCDRLVARALWDLGYTEQPKGGITVLNFEQYLTKWKFAKITKQSDLKEGDIILMKANGTSSPTPAWHAFVITAYNPSTTICSKYDEGSQSRIDAGGFFKNVPLNEWSNRTFYCGFRLPQENRLPTKGQSYAIESALNKAYCIDSASGSTVENTNLQLYKKNGTPAQSFIPEDVKDGYVRLVNKKSGLVVSVAGGKAENKKNIRLESWDGKKSQMWKMRENADTSVTFESALSANYVIDAAGGKAVNKTNVWLYGNNNTKAQRWYLRKE